MTADPDPVLNDEVDQFIRRHAADLVRRNELLRKDNLRLFSENCDLSRRLDEAVSWSHAERETRRAALNLMEDAIAARRAEIRENAERRRVEEELREADRRKDEFLATLAHELRNPLAPIRNGLHILRVAGVSGESAERLHEMIERQINHMVRLVDDLLEVSRITRGKVELRKETVDLADAVRGAVETSKLLIDDARHRLEVNLPDEPLLLDADPVRLTQVLSNLLNNAAKYTEPGGRIWLTAWRQNTDAMISVRDTGAGIPADMLPKVFDLFTRVEHSYDRVPGGLGIGLTLVRSLVDLHGGTVEVRSEGPGRGSEFILRLPLATGQAVPQTPARQPDRSQAIAQHRIVVVDDNRDAAETLSTLLEFLGAEVRTFHNGPDALKEIPAFRPTVVLLDIGMPSMDGNEVARRIRRMPEGRDVTLIALTGWGQEEDRRRSKEAGFNHHLIKPVDSGALQALIATLPAPQPLPVTAGG